jgi:PrtD family type I secretion system ABC transporter
MPRLFSPIFLAGLIGYKRYLACAGIFSFFMNILTLAIPLYSIQVYDRVMVSGSGSTLLVLTIAVLGGLGAATALEDIRTRLLVALGIHFDGQLAARVFEREIESENVTGHRSSGRTIRDLDQVRHVLTGSGALALFDLPWTPLFIAVCFYLHALLGVITLFGTLVVFALALANQWLVERPLKASAEETEASYRLTDGAIANAETVRAMGMLPDLARRWTAMRSSAISSQASASTLNASISSVIKFSRYTLQVATLAAGAWLVVDRELSAGGLFASSMICTRALMPIDQIVAVWRQLTSGWAALQRVEAALAGPGIPRAMKLPRPQGRISAENLVFVPAGSKVPTISNVSFEVEPGDAVGVVGPSAAGKSTLARLVVGAIRPSHGSVRLDGAETWTYDRSDFGALVGYLSQSVELFEGTIADNIARFRQADSLAIVAAARTASVHEMILSLPKGYETVLAPSGAPLSGGQRQRIALARAVFGDPKLVVLDEPNSNLDGEGEAALHNVLAVLKARRATVFMIAHRPSMLVALDKVLVLRNGTVGEFGTVERVMPRIAPGFPVAQKRIAGHA